MLRLRHAALLLLLSVTACGDDDGEPDAATDTDAETPTTVQLVFDDGSDAFFDLPFPLETRRKTDGTLDLEGYPNPRSLSLAERYLELGSLLDGFSPTGTVYMRFDGPLDVDAFPDPAASRETSSPILLVDVDPSSSTRGALTPVRVAFTEVEDPYRPANLLQVQPVPGFELAEDRLYALVVKTALGSGDAMRPLVQNEALGAVLGNDPPEGALGDAFGPLRDTLDMIDTDVDDIAAATVFRTNDPTASLRAMVAHVLELDAPAPETALALVYESDDYCAYGSTWDAPQFQAGEPPFMPDGGEMQYDADGAPVAQRHDSVPFVLTVPKSTMPAAGYPLVVYVNGTGGLSRQVIDRGQSIGGAEAAPGTGPAMRFARRGWASAGTAGPLTDERVGAASSQGGLAMYNLANPVAMRDNFFQSVAEQILFRKMLESIEIDASDCEGATERAHYDVENLAIMGQSLGSYVAGMVSALVPGYRGAVLTGAGGSWVEFPFGVRTVDLELVTRALLGLRPTDPFDRFHPIITILDLAVGPADNTHYVDHLVRRPFEGHDPLHVLVIEGDEDDYIGPGLQRALVSAVGPDLIGADVGPEEGRIEDAITLAGHSQLTAPATGNFSTEDGPRTVGVVRYLPDATDAGHYVAFQLEPPMHQYGCFVQTLAGGGVPVIVAGEGADDPCD